MAAVSHVHGIHAQHALETWRVVRARTVDINAAREPKRLEPAHVGSWHWSATPVTNFTGAEIVEGLVDSTLSWIIRSQARLEIHRFTPVPYDRAHQNWRLQKVGPVMDASHFGVGEVTVASRCCTPYALRLTTRSTNPISCVGGPRTGIGGLWDKAYENLLLLSAKDGRVSISPCVACGLLA